MGPPRHKAASAFGLNLINMGLRNALNARWFHLRLRNIKLLLLGRLLGGQQRLSLPLAPVTVAGNGSAEASRSLAKEGSDTMNTSAINRPSLIEVGIARMQSSTAFRQRICPVVADLVPLRGAPTINVRPSGVPGNLHDRDSRVAQADVVKEPPNSHPKVGVHTARVAAKVTSAHDTVDDLLAVGVKANRRHATLQGKEERVQLASAGILHS